MLARSWGDISGCDLAILDCCKEDDRNAEAVFAGGVSRICCSASANIPAAALKSAQPALALYRVHLRVEETVLFSCALACSNSFFLSSLKAIGDSGDMSKQLQTDRRVKAQIDQKSRNSEGLEVQKEIQLLGEACLLARQLLMTRCCRLACFWGRLDREARKRFSILCPRRQR